MILLRISLPDLHFIHRRHPPNFFWIRQLLRNLLCKHQKSTYVQPDRQTDRQTEILFCLFCLLRHTKHEHSSKGENFFFSHAITILSLFTFSVYDEKVTTGKNQRFFIRTRYSNIEKVPELSRDTVQRWVNSCTFEMCMNIFSKSLWWCQYRGKIDEIRQIQYCFLIIQRLQSYQQLYSSLNDSFISFEKY